jgi:hypothetical protein
LLIDAHTAVGFVDVRTVKLDSASFRGQPGFSLELDMATSKGLVYRALILSSSGADTLSYACYVAPHEHYFGRDRAEVDALFRQLR